MSSSGLFSLAKWRKLPQQKLIIIMPVAKLPAGTQEYLRSIMGHLGPIHYLQVSTRPRSWGVTVFFIWRNFDLKNMISTCTTKDFSWKKWPKFARF